MLSELEQYIIIETMKEYARNQDYGAWMLKNIQAMHNYRLRVLVGQQQSLLKRESQLESAQSICNDLKSIVDALEEVAKFYEFFLRVEFSDGNTGRGLMNKYSELAKEADECYKKVREIANGKEAFEQTLGCLEHIDSKLAVLDDILIPGASTRSLGKETESEVNLVWKHGE